LLFLYIIYLLIVFLLAVFFDISSPIRTIPKKNLSFLSQ
jgi:hypothetical protein